MPRMFPRSCRRTIFSASLFHTRTTGRAPLHRFQSAGDKLALLLLLFCLGSPFLRGQSRNVVCRDGDGEFATESPSGVRVRVGPSIADGLATRVCAGELRWNDQKLEVANAAPQLDIDAFGVDLGLGSHVAALQVKKSKTECCVDYEIYSLRPPPALLRRITGGEFYSAGDTDLDGRVEIWTNDAAAVEGFENLKLRDIDFAPPLILRFGSKGRLLDASAEFKPYFDQRIEEQRRKVDRQDLADFKESEGNPAQTLPSSASRQSRMKNTKMHVLEIVWCYLYSGREKEAWAALAEMWPPTDLERIRAALVNAREHGIRSQVDGVSTPVRPGRENHAKIFDGTVVVAATPGLTPKDVKPKQEITPPRAIMMARQPPVTALEIELAETESILELVIDAAGKVRSAEELGNYQAIDEGLIKSTANWKFIPAYDKGEPVASRILLGVSLRR